MRKAFVHEEVLLAPLEAELRRRGADVKREYPVQVGGRTLGFIDLYAERVSMRLACEAELTPRRVSNDIKKAITAGVSLLLIVTPTSRVASRVRLTWGDGPQPPEGLEVCVLPLGRALGLIRDCFPLIPGAFPGPESNQDGRG